MRTRDKILVLLLTITLALGALIYSRSRHDDTSLARFRYFVLNHPARNISNAVRWAAESTSDSDKTAILGYGSLSLLAILMGALVLRSVGNAERRALRDRLVDAQVAKAELESLLQDSLWKEKDARAVRETALEELQASASRIIALEDQLAANERLLRKQEGQLKALRFQTDRSPEMISSSTPEPATLRDELRKMADLLQEKESAAKQLEKGLSERIDALENQLESKEKLIGQRGQELAALGEQLAKAETTKQETEALIAQKLRNEKQALQAKGIAMEELREDLSAKISTLDSRLSENLKLLKSRSAELDAARSEVNRLTAHLVDVTSGKEGANRLLQEELKKKTEALELKDGAFRKMQTDSNAIVSGLENQIREKDALLERRHTELKVATAQLSQLESSQQQLGTLGRKLRATMEALQAKELALKELEDSSNQLATSLNERINEQQDLLKRRDEELEVLRSTLYAREVQPEHIKSAGPRREVDLTTEDEDTANALETRAKRFAALESAMYDKDDLLKTRDEKIARLEAELKEKRAELAKHEILVWQAYERRTLWKQRLAKFGISIKD